jgi:drug/metabolite transporter (DMT)-like permease
MLLRIAPVLFVLLWSTGFIGSKLGSADAEPFTFLSLRFALAIVVLLPVAVLRASPKGDWRKRGHAALVGALIHGGYLGGVFWAIRHAMPAGVVALIVSLQPILTSVLAGPLLGERLAARHWAGLALGLLGALLIVGPKLGGFGSGVNGATLAATVISLLAITFGTLYQKRFGSGVDLVDGAIWQYLGALAVVGGGAALFETHAIIWTPKFIFALSWLVFALSIGAVLLLMLLIRQHAVSGVSGLFYLVPACTALMAYFMFDERLTVLQIAGMAAAIAGVVLIAVRKPARTDGDAIAAIAD